MKQHAYITIILFAVTALAVLCKHKFSKYPDDLTSFENTISGMEKIIPTNQPFSLQIIHAKAVFQFYTRYTFAPRHLYYPVIKTDTLLIINHKSLTDSVMRTVGYNKRVLWQNNDTEFSYTLVCNK